MIIYVSIKLSTCVVHFFVIGNVKKKILLTPDVSPFSNTILHLLALLSIHPFTPCHAPHRPPKNPNPLFFTSSIHAFPPSIRHIQALFARRSFSCSYQLKSRWKVTHLTPTPPRTLVPNPSRSLAVSPWILPRCMQQTQKPLVLDSLCFPHLKGLSSHSLMPDPQWPCLCVQDPAGWCPPSLPSSLSLFCRSSCLNVVI